LAAAEPNIRRSRTGALWTGREHVVLGLLSNALKFTLAGEIVVTLGVQGDEIVLTVTDSGVGIGPEELPHLFERFHQASRTRARGQEGTGIGLALVQELAKLHGGRVGVTSAPGQGSAFTVAIPRGSAHLPADRIRADVVTSRVPAAGSYVEEAQRWLPSVPRVTVESAAGSNAPDIDRAPAPDQGRAPDAAHPPRLLVVEDNADLREYLTRLLEDRGVVTGELSLSRAAEEAFYYIAQEALSNALKHARATKVVVRISGRPTSTELTVTDDGCGFDSDLASKGGGVGLVSNQERARRIGATVTVGRGRRGGTQVTVTLKASGRRSAPDLTHESGHPNRDEDACPDRSAS
jgi:signal transduction histidine kinase